MESDQDVRACETLPWDAFGQCLTTELEIQAKTGNGERNAAAQLTSSPLPSWGPKS